MPRPDETPTNDTSVEAEFSKPTLRFDETDIRAYMQIPDEGPLRDIDDYAAWLDGPGGGEQ